MDTTSWSALFMTIFGSPHWLAENFKSINYFALCLAAAPPILMLIARSEIRLRRLRAISDFMVSFDLLDDDSCNKKSTKNPSCEFVKSKYIADLKLDSDLFKDYKAAKTEGEKLSIYITAAERRWKNTPYMMIVAAIAYFLLGYFGFSFLGEAYYSGFSTIGFAIDKVPPHDQYVLIVGTMAFAGAYIGATRMLLRSLAIFDLSSFSFLRQSTEIIFSVMLVMLIFKAFPDPFINIARAVAGPTDTIVVTEKVDKVTQTGTTDQTKPAEANKVNNSSDRGLPWIWFALAPVLGLLPTSSSKFLLMKMQTLISWIKTTDDRFIPVSKVLTLDIIDGIDFETRFLLEEVGIYDVQNLATFNPVMLHIESSYGIYQCIDWIAQAQLCHILGPEKFLMLREANVRTIFDLERAIDSKDSPDIFDEIYAAILFAPTEGMRKASEISSFKFLTTDDSGTPRLVSVDEYCQWARKKLWHKANQPVNPNNNNPPVPNNQKNEEENLTQAVEHMMVWISDDLHVRRLRRLWWDITKSLGPEAESFPDSKRRKYSATACEPKCQCTKKCDAENYQAMKSSENTRADTNGPATGGGDNAELQKENSDIKTGNQIAEVKPNDGKDTAESGNP